jgi:hypothetical protein
LIFLIFRLTNRSRGTVAIAPAP